MEVNPNYGCSSTFKDTKIIVSSNLNLVGKFRVNHNKKSSKESIKNKQFCDFFHDHNVTILVFEFSLLSLILVFG